MNIVVFVVADREYALDVMQVRELIRIREVTQVPDASDFVKGVIGLNGKVIPVVSLRKKFGFEDASISGRSRIIVTKVESHVVGVVVDEVVDVVPVKASDITPPDDVFRDVEHLIGVVKIENRLIMLVDIEKVFGEVARNGIEAIHKRVVVRTKNESRK